MIGVAYRRVHAMLRREDPWKGVNCKRVQRLYREQGLAGICSPKRTCGAFGIRLQVPGDYIWALYDAHNLDAGELTRRVHAAHPPP